MNMVCDVDYIPECSTRFNNVDKVYIERFKNKNHLIIIYNEYGVKREHKIPLKYIKRAVMLSIKKKSKYNYDIHEWFRYEKDKWDDNFSNEIGIQKDNYIWFEEDDENE